VRDGVKKELEKLGPLLFEKLMQEHGLNISQSQQAEIL